MKNHIEHPGAFCDTNGMLREWSSADLLPPDWQGFAKIDSTIFFVGREDDQRSFTALQSKTMPEARLEMAARLAQFVLKATGGLREAMEAADDAFHRELVRVYGANNAGNARFMFKHSDPNLQQAADAFVASSDAWRDVLRKARKDASVQEAVLNAPINTCTGKPAVASCSPRPVTA